MAYKVLPYVPNYPLRHSVTRELITNDFGDGYIQIVSAESLYSRADGTGGQNAHYGVYHFNLHFNKRLAGINKVANELWKFFRDRLNNSNEPFCFYNPAEVDTIDLTGTSPTGRYLVRLAEPNQILNREYYVYSLFNYGGIHLIETRLPFTTTVVPPVEAVGTYGRVAYRPLSRSRLNPVQRP